jgi:hypothetical protein
MANALIGSRYWECGIGKSDEWCKKLAREILDLLEERDAQWGDKVEHQMRDAVSMLQDEAANGRLSRRHDTRASDNRCGWRLERRKQDNDRELVSG